MSVRDYEERVNRASIFVTEFPQSAIDFLATHFEKAQLEEEIKRCCTRHGEDFPAILFRQRSSSNQSQSTNNPRPPFSTVLQAVPANGHFQPLQQPFPASPPTSSGSEFSHARGHAGEIVLAFDGSYQQQPLSMVKANVRHNWIRADIVHNRLRLQIRPCEGIGYVSAQFAGAPSGVLHATQQISLTWRKPDSDATEHMICYLVYERIGADLLMGEQVLVTPAHMNTSPPPHPLSPQPQRPGDFAMPPPTGTWVQTDSYASGASTVTPYTQQHIPTGLNIISGNPGDPNYQRVDNWRQMSSSAVPSQVPFAAPPTTSATPTRQSPATIMADSLLRIKVKWDGSTLPVKINLNASGDALVAQLQSTFSKRALDRTAFQLRLSTNRDPNAADADEVLVSFNEAELQGDWQDAVAWTKEQTTSSIYGKIEPVDNPG